eukprot:Opistho-2@53765
MHFTLDDDDDGGFVPDNQSSGKLAALFRTDAQHHQGGNEKLTYQRPTAPKGQPQAQAPQAGQAQKAPETMSLIHACVGVHIYKFINNQYASQGKFGLAIVGMHSAPQYKLLVYVNNQQRLCEASVTDQFSFTVQPNNYASFYDDQRQNWSILFNSEKEITDFSKHLVACKYNCSPKLLTLDLAAGEDAAVGLGDSVEMRYTGWLVSGGAIGQMFDTNVNKDKAHRFKIGAGKVIKGWDEGVVGMKKSGRRLIVIPPALAYGDKSPAANVPANSTLLFEVQAIKVKIGSGGGDAKEAAAPAAATATSSAATAGAKPPVASKPDAAAVEESRVRAASRGHSSEDLRARTSSLNEAMSTPGEGGKAKVISRMAKLGRATLPFKGAVAATPDTEDDDLEESQPPSPAPAQQPQPVVAARPVPSPRPTQEAVASRRTSSNNRNNNSSSSSNNNNNSHNNNNNNNSSSNNNNNSHNNNNNNNSSSNNNN